MKENMSRFSTIFSQKKFYVYLVWIALAAALSQVAEWAHLKYAGDWFFLLAVLAALGFAAVEYVNSVPANRYGRDQVGLDYFELQAIWTTLQIAAHAVMMKAIFQITPNVWNVLGYLLLIGGCVLSFIGHDDKQT